MQAHPLDLAADIALEIGKGVEMDGAKAVVPVCFSRRSRRSSSLKVSMPQPVWLRMMNSSVPSR
jgi:hypothetical protein